MHIARDIDLMILYLKIKLLISPDPTSAFKMVSRSSGANSPEECQLRENKNVV